MKILKEAKEFGVEWILTGVALLDTYLSIYYTWAWHDYTGERFWEALSFSVVVVLFAVIIFEFAVRQWITLKEDGTRHRSAYILFLMWAVVVLYSMQTTVAGQFINVMKDQVATLEAQGAARVAGVQVPILEEEIASLDQEIASYEGRKAQLEKVLSGVDSVEKIYEWKRTTASVQAQWEEVSGMIREARTRRAQAVDELRQTKTQDRIEELKGAGTDVFAFYAQVLGIEDTSKVHFALAVFKGVILDLINVICFALVQLRSKWRKEEHERIEEVAIEARRDPTKRAMSVAEILADESFGPDSSGKPHFCGRARATRELGINPSDYERIVSIGVQSGVLKRRGGRTYKASWATREDFLAEVARV